MSRLQQLAPESATGKVQSLFTSVQSKLGMVPNMMRAMGNSPVALESYLQFSASLTKGELTAQQREQIALAASEANGCDYCVAAHSTIGRMVGLTSDQIRDSRLSTAVDSKNNALLQFVRKVVEERGHVSNDDLDGLRTHGFTEGQIAEVVANIAINLFTNYFNHIAETDIDFPKAPALNVEPASTN